MSVTTKLEVEYSQFKKGMAEAQASVKTLDAELKLSEAQFKASGDAEKYFAEQADLLKQKLNAQKDAAKAAEEMLLNLGKRGVAPTSTEYQRMAQRMLNAQAAVASTQAQLNSLDTKQKAAASSAKDLATEVGGIGKNVSLQNISDGLSKITSGMERAYRTAVRFGKTVMRSMMDATGWADDVMTRAVQYGTDAETIQKMDRVAAYIDTDVDTIIRAKDQLSKNQKNMAELLGISSDGRNVDDVFWEAGEAILALGEGFDQNEYAMKIFGKSWRELLPLFTAGREEYESLMESQDVLSAEQVETLAKADDEIQKVQNEIQNLKNQFWAEHSGTVIELLEWVVNNKDAVVAALTAIGAGFAALRVAETAANIAKIVSGLKTIINTGGQGGTPTGGPTVVPTGGTGTGGMLVAGGGKIAGGVANYLTSTGGMLTVGGVLLAPIVTKALNGTLIEDPAKAAGIDQNTADLFNRALNGGKVGIGGGAKAQDMVNALTGGKKVEVPVEPKAEEGAADDVSKQIGVITLPAQIRVMSAGGFAVGGGGGGIDPLRQAIFGGMKGYANGIPWVDSTQLALLHRGERVLTASENRQYTYNSNTYFGSVNLNNGTQVEQLAEAISRNNRRQSRAYGS